MICLNYTQKTSKPPFKKEKEEEEDTKQKKGKIIKHIMGIVKQAYLEP